MRHPPPSTVELPSIQSRPTPDTLDAAITAALSAAQVDVVFLAGYLKRLGPATLGAFRGRVLNTHPALLPKFGGQGMFGDQVFEAVLASGESESGVSVHLVDDDYDSGRVIRQVRVPVEAKDCVESLKARVRECERHAWCRHSLPSRLASYDFLPQANNQTEPTRSNSLCAIMSQKRAGSFGA